MNQSQQYWLSIMSHRDCDCEGCVTLRTSEKDILGFPVEKTKEGDWTQTAWPIVDHNNLIYLDVHAGSMLSDATVHIPHMQADTGIIYDPGTSKYHYVAIIDYPGVGPIWHQVTTVDGKLIFGEEER